MGSAKSKKTDNARFGCRSKGRREFLRLGLSGFGSLSLPGLFRLRAAAANASPNEKTAVILVWLRGGASHLETFDPKPDAPSEFRGPFKTIKTNVAGLRVCELLPRLATIADKYTVLRSMAHTGGGHPAGSLQLLSGDPDAADKVVPKYPDLMSVAHYLRSDPTRKIPNFVGVNGIKRYDSFTIAGPAYLGPAYEPFRIEGDPSRPDFVVPDLSVKSENVQRLEERVALRDRLDRLSADVDASGTMRAMDSFESQAMNLLTNPQIKEAFDLSKENPKLRERYGLNAWGQQCLMARRLVESGVELITTTFDGPLCGRVANWDDHAVNHHVFDANAFRMPVFDQAVSALIEDVYARGLDKRLLVVVTGEFGRTPRISYVESSGGGVASAPKGVKQPGRDHWPRANSMIFAGGGIQTGQVIGATDARGEDVTDRRVGPGDFLATVYHHLGIDAEHVTIPDLTGRPIHILPNGKPIPELIS